MTSGAQRQIEHLDQDACWAHLREAQVGRLAFEARDRIAIVPLNFVVRGPRLVFRTSGDAELFAEQRLPVSFEVDGWDAGAAWSVVARGALQRNTDVGSVALENEIGLVPWAPDEGAPRTALVDLVVDQVTGRTFHRRRWQSPRWYW
ncbi:pyridoxamine 5'-phosphate oxidase family protein [Amnibacterium sp.]|uniref:pyridoxamine 5'-phosphate oxidase family protein n=1 Tax=Amnibacterium sp. TaxID=1872496 RepID=UPI002623EDB2|nr:pyridoxamine 5'-phosphate oxidase family protein [Amnibacterium sp.]MCU1473354.1 pyridoxamine 5-phosphate oxidase family protein [Amnibacterium sp.]